MIDPKIEAAEIWMLLSISQAASKISEAALKATHLSGPTTWVEGSTSPRRAAVQALLAKAEELQSKIASLL